MYTVKCDIKNSGKKEEEIIEGFPDFETYIQNGFLFSRDEKNREVVPMFGFNWFSARVMGKWKEREGDKYGLFINKLNSACDPKK